MEAQIILKSTVLNKTEYTILLHLHRMALIGTGWLGEHSWAIHAVIPYSRKYFTEENYAIFLKQAFHTIYFMICVDISLLCVSG